MWDDIYFCRSCIAEANVHTENIQLCHRLQTTMRNILTRTLSNSTGSALCNSMIRVVPSKELGSFYGVVTVVSPWLRKLHSSTLAGNNLKLIQFSWNYISAIAFKRVRGWQEIFQTPPPSLLILCSGPPSFIFFFSHHSLLPYFWLGAPLLYYIFIFLSPPIPF